MNPKPIPQYVIDALAGVRESSITNMFSRDIVIRVVGDLGWEMAAHWLEANKGRYMDALNAMGKAVSANANPYGPRVEKG